MSSVDVIPDLRKSFGDGTLKKKESKGEKKSPFIANIMYTVNILKEFFQET